MVLLFCILIMYKTLNIVVELIKFQLIENFSKEARNVQFYHYCNVFCLKTFKLLTSVLGITDPKGGNTGTLSDSIYTVHCLIYSGCRAIHTAIALYSRAAVSHDANYNTNTKV